MIKVKAQKKKFLVFSPHPDDLDFGCAGTAADLTAKGHEVVYCIITNGEKGVHKVHQTKRTMIAMREREQHAAAEVVGVSEIIFLRQTDGDLEHTKSLRKKITQVIREVKPNVILSHDPGNQTFDSFYRFHRDHRVSAEVIFDAMYPAVGSRVFFPELAKQDILPHQLDEAWFYSTDRPNYFVDITHTIDKKIEALCKHKCQITDFKWLDQWIRKRALEAAKKKRYKYAEAFRRLSFDHV